MSSNAYREVLNQDLKLTPEDQLRLLEDLAANIRREITAHSNKHSVMEFKGFARELWEGVDVAQYIEEERNSWER